MKHKSHNYNSFAKSYSALGFENTYYLAFRDIPTLLQQHCRGTSALDHGCGTGRSSRFLKQLGYSVVGFDINNDMIAKARELDPTGAYELLSGTKLPFPDQSFDLVFQSFVAAEVSDHETMIVMFSEIARVLKADGVALIITGNAEQRHGEWASFVYKTKNDKPPPSGEQVELRIRGTDIVVFDYNWYHRDFEQAFRLSDLHIAERYRPMATGKEPFIWYQERTRPFWDIYILSKGK